MGVRQSCGYVFGVDGREAALNFRRVGDIKVVGDTAVFLVEKVVGVEECLQLVAVAHIGGREAPRESFGGLIFIAAFRIGVVKPGADLCALVDIAGEEHTQIVLGDLSAPAGVIA